MGVDARILIKIVKPESWLNPTSLRQLSTRLTTVLGHELFFLNPDENRHALSFVLDDYRKWAEDYPEDYPNFNPNIAVWSQDGDDIVAEPNEQFVEVHLFSRYYGEGYERGDWKTLSWVMLWCIFNIPDCEVWYGGDSSGICAEHMTSRRMTKMTKFYLTSNGDEYMRHYKTPHTCEFCGCGVLNLGGSGRGAAKDVKFWSCEGCGSQWVTEHQSQYGPVTVTKYDDRGADYGLKGGMASFEISNQISADTRMMYPFDGTFRIKYPYVASAVIESLKELPAPAKLLTAGD